MSTAACPTRAAPCVLECMGILDRHLDRTAFAIVDVETTGLIPGHDRVVEICVVVADPGDDLRVTLDTLIHPGRPLTGTPIHRIAEEDVREAPPFAEVAGEIVRALSGRVLVGHNVGFDLRLLRDEFRRVGVPLDVPFVDTMTLRPGLADGPRATLSQACAAHGVPRTGEHVASADALDTASLFGVLLNRVRTLGIRTFRELGRCVDASFVESWTADPLDASLAEALPALTARRSRLADRISVAGNQLRLYYDALMVAISDLTVSDQEAGYLQALRLQLGLEVDQIAMLHAQAYAGALMALIADRRLDDLERGRLRDLADCLRRAGYCPGD